MSAGKFIDNIMRDQGKYFECTQSNGCKFKRRILFNIIFSCINSISFGTKILCKRTAI
jgi:hypothetical protein